MINKTVEAAINEQMRHEFYSAHLYLAMSAWAEANNLSGAAHWLRAQYGEEQGHAMKFYRYIVEQGGRVTVGALAQPPAEWTSLLDLFQQVLEHEKKVTALLVKLYETTVAEKDYASQFLLQWFISEQVEEESNSTKVIDAIKMVGNSGTSLYMVDRQLAARA
jgi:ferritin